MPSVRWLTGPGWTRGRYVLQPRTGEFADFDKWFKEVEGPLGDAFRRAARELGLPADARLKYEAFATAQEIHAGAFAVPDAREHGALAAQLAANKPAQTG